MPEFFEDPGAEEDEAMSITDPSAHGRVVAIVRDLRPHDELGLLHQDVALRWLDSTSDIYRRRKPATPSPHLVCYFLMVDRRRQQVLLGDHRSSGLWLPSGGHVEPGEDPVDTVRREIIEELGVEATFDPVHGSRPFFITVTDTVGTPSQRHTDVSLWFAVLGDPDRPLDPDPREYRQVAWWSASDIGESGSAGFEPHLSRALSALPLDRSW